MHATAADLPQKLVSLFCPNSMWRLSKHWHLEEPSLVI